jgi:fused signal recognition particle receptor
MKSWLNALARTRDKLAQGLARLVPGLAKADPAALEEWESILIGADVAPRLVGEWVEHLRRRAGAGDIRAEIEALLLAALPATEPWAWPAAPRPTVVLIAGVNGSGKTTTAAKLARRARQDGLKPLLAAADTFRAAGSHQLQLWAERLGVDAVGGAQGADSAAVAFDALQAGVARKADLVFVDTAGRMHTKAPLMEELQKVRRSMGKAVPGAPHESWIVLDATLGNNALVQARVFKEAIQLTGAVIAKLDGSSKAGFVFSIRRELGLPVRFVGLGEGPDDLAPFEAREFVKGLLGGE